MGHWEDFVSTGKIQDYLTYAKEKQTFSNKVQQEMAERKDGVTCAGENQCHGNDHKTDIGKGI